MSTTELNLPQYDFRTGTIDGKEVIYDDLRQSYVRLTPEEWVRQHVVRYLIDERAYPGGLLSVEHAFTYQDMPRRADIVVFSRKASPMLMIECKAPSVPIGQTTFDQVARYNKVINAAYLAVTNGLKHYCSRLDHNAGTYEFLDNIPHFEELQAA